jgi:hypothetical protein
MKPRTIITFLLLFSALLASARHGNSRPEKRVKATYTYIAPETVTLEQAKLTALTRAKTQAIADEFGMLVYEVSTTTVSNQNGHSDTDVQSTGGSEVAGEWIETTSGPEYDIRYTDGMLMVSVALEGRIRGLSTTQPKLDVKVLRNGTEERFADCNFVSGDDMFLSVTSPAAGYLSVYLVTPRRQAFRLLPYRRNADTPFSVEPGRDYILFHKQSADAAERRRVDEYVMETYDPLEVNTLYVIFSTSNFARALDSQIERDLPAELSENDFRKWLALLRLNDDNVTVREIPLTIRRQ